jgi:amino acid adenylation domain-containing protein
VALLGAEAVNIFEQQWSRDHNSDNSEDTIVSRFERQVAAVPDGLAIVTDEISLTYRALDVMASRIAAVLASLPSQRDRPIMLFMKDEAARLAAMLGALKANRIFIPLAPDSPQNWVAQVVEDSGAAQIIVDSSSRSIAELAATGSVTVMEVQQLARSLQSVVADRTASADDTAYIVYTSGSTGRPKGVAISHRSSIRNCGDRNPVAKIGHSDRYANLASSGVYAWIRNSFSPLLSGSCLFPFDLRRHGLQKLTPWLIDQKITYVSFSGSLLRTWLASLPDNLRFPSLRFVGGTGERLYAQDVIRVSRHLEGDWQIGHAYSSTEAGFIATQIFTPLRLPDSGIVAAGCPVDWVEICIKDEPGALVPPGEIGEIVVRSRFLAQGYWNNPKLTAEVFQTDPLDSSIRIYSTGDLGRWRSDGMLEHMGRKGRRIKLRGYNIEPIQVETELIRQPGVTDAVVVLHDSAAGKESCLVGYVVSPANASPSAMREGLAERLPSYMVPSHIVVLNAFPIASSGKIDLNALPPSDRTAARSLAFRTPAEDHEHKLLAIWQEILDLPKIGIDDDFFELGGDSLHALVLFVEIEARLGYSLSPTTIVQAPTIAGLAEFIRATTGIAASQSLVPLRASGSGLPLFLLHNRYCYVMYYRHLLRDLKSDRPVFGLQPLPLDGKHRIPRTIEAMAADYITEIRRVQPHGPYFLAGHSFGGRISFEIAQQLVRDGERVSFLGLIDTGVFDAVGASPLESKAVRLSRKVRGVKGFRDLFVRGLRFIRSPVYLRPYELWLRLGRSIPYEHRPTFYDLLCARAYRDYVLKPYTGHITMFSSAGNSERQRAYWEPLARGGLTVLEMPAGHDDVVLPPYSKILAEHFDTCLDATVRAEELMRHRPEGIVSRGFLAN